MMASPRPRANQIVRVDLPNGDYGTCGYANSRDDTPHMWAVYKVDYDNEEFLGVPLTSKLEHQRSGVYKHVRTLDKRYVKPQPIQHRLLLGGEVALLSFRQLVNEPCSRFLLPQGVAVLDELFHEMIQAGQEGNARYIDRLEALDAATKETEGDSPSSNP